MLTSWNSSAFVTYSNSSFWFCPNKAVSSCLYLKGSTVVMLADITTAKIAVVALCLKLFANLFLIHSMALTIYLMCLPEYKYLFHGKTKIRKALFSLDYPDLVANIHRSRVLLKSTLSKMYTQNAGATFLSLTL